MKCEFNTACSWARIVRCGKPATQTRTVVAEPGDDASGKRLDPRAFCDEHAAECKRMDKPDWHAEYAPIRTVSS